MRQACHRALANRVAGVPKAAVLVGGDSIGYIDFSAGLGLALIANALQEPVDFTLAEVVQQPHLGHGWSSRVADLSAAGPLGPK